MNRDTHSTLALFYCQNVPQSSEAHRQDLEHEYGPRLRLFPIPCSGRLEPVHLLRALEEFADLAYVVTCPEGACRYFEGNLRARRRVEQAQKVLFQIGLEPERVGIRVGSVAGVKGLAQWVNEILDQTAPLGPSPVHGRNQVAGQSAR